MKTKLRTIEGMLPILLAVGLFVSVSTVQGRHDPLSDAMIKTLVEHQLIKHELQREDNIRVSVDDHMVTLEGTVLSLAEKKRAQQEASRVEDVARVENHLVIEASDRSDQQIADHAARSIRSFVFYDIFDWIEGEVRNGVVNLKGWVREPWRKDDYQRLVETVPGVRRVNNEVEILPTSPFDDQIRVAAVRAIYGHPAFLRYANRRLPPIHVIVQNGNITLKGAVAQKLERQLAESLVRTGVLAFEVTNDLTVDTKMGKKS